MFFVCLIDYVLNYSSQSTAVAALLLLFVASKEKNLTHNFGTYVPRNNCVLIAHESPVGVNNGLVLIPLVPFFRYHLYLGRSHSCRPI